MIGSKNKSPMHRMEKKGEAECYKVLAASGLFEDLNTPEKCETALKEKLRRAEEKAKAKEEKAKAKEEKAKAKEEKAKAKEEKAKAKEEKAKAKKEKAKAKEEKAKAKEADTQSKKTNKSKKTTKAKSKKTTDGKTKPYLKLMNYASVWPNWRQRILPIKIKINSLTILANHVTLVATSPKKKRLSIAQLHPIVLKTRT